MRGVRAGPTARARRPAGGVWVTVSIRKISLGAGYRYLMSSVARGDGAGPTSSPLTRYYAESGTPPGRFLGAGLAGLAGGQGVRAGSTVTEEHLFRMLGMLQDPISGEQLGRSPRATGPSRIDRFGRAGKPAGAVAGVDLTFSAPKSVSVAWAVGDPATQVAICRAHVAAGGVRDRVWRTGGVQLPLR